MSSYGKNGSLGEFCILLVVDWVCYRFVAVKGVAHGGVYRLGFCGQPCSEVRLLVVSDHTKLTISTVLNV